jgi:hypothetical protein
VSPEPNEDEVTVREWRQVSGAFQIRIPVTDRTVMLRPEENTLAVIRWRLDNMTAANRWRPVLERYLDYVTARVKGLRGNPDSIPASLEGAPGRKTGGSHSSDDHHGHERECYLGKVDELVYDRFGDLRAFTLRLNDGRTQLFDAREPQMERVLRAAWEMRSVVRVDVTTAGDGSYWPVDVRLVRPH